MIDLRFRPSSSTATLILEWHIDGPEVHPGPTSSTRIFTERRISTSFTLPPGRNSSHSTKNIVAMSQPPSRSPSILKGTHDVPEDVDLSIAPGVPAPKRRKENPTGSASVVLTRRRSSTYSGTSAQESSVGPNRPKKEGSVGPTSAAAAPAKSKRVRTGCLTCRERHLKCDEAMPDCLNCRKSNRECKRGVRLNFIDVQVRDHPMLPPTSDWAIKFQDESRQIAGEYQGGLNRYPAEPKLSESLPGSGPSSSGGLFRPESSRYGSHHGSPALDSVTSPLNLTSRWLNIEGNSHHSHIRSGSDFAIFADMSNQPSAFSQPSQTMFLNPGKASYKASDTASNISSLHGQSHAPPSIIAGGSVSDGGVTSTNFDHNISPDCEYVNSPEELMFMQVFVREVGTWMDWLDRAKHFSQDIPYLSRVSTMLHHACLACGALHLAITKKDPSYADKAQVHHDTATTYLLRSIQNPDREESGSVECATTAVVLHVYEIMQLEMKPSILSHHTSGARALIKECKWNPQSKGIGGACFWFNVGVEILSCLRNDWALSDLDKCHMDLDFGNSQPTPTESSTTDSHVNLESLINEADQDIWVYRMVWIMRKIVEFKTSAQVNQSRPQHEQISTADLFSQWQELKKLCDDWNTASPQIFRPLGYLYTSQTSSRSAFPEVWLVKPMAIVARLFYHMAQCILAATHPIEPSSHRKEMLHLQLHHAHQLCGIILHADTRGLTCVASQCLAITTLVFTDRKEQDEVLEIFDKLAREGNWPLSRLKKELRQKWGHELSPTPSQTPSLPGSASASSVIEMSSASAVTSNPLSASGSASQPGIQRTQSSHHHSNSGATSTPQIVALPTRQINLTKKQEKQQKQIQAAQVHLQQAHLQQQAAHAQARAQAQAHAAHMQAVQEAQAQAQAQAHADLFNLGLLPVGNNGMNQTGLVNPLVTADFSLPNHPYQNFYNPRNDDHFFDQ